MALIKCSECGKEISDKAEVCVNCGNPINQKKESKVMVYGYTESYLLNPPVKIFIGENQVGTVKKGGLFENDIETDIELTFKCNMRKAKVEVKAGRVTKIKLSWNRLTGQLVPQIVDFNTANGKF